MSFAFVKVLPSSSLLLLILINVQRLTEIIGEFVWFPGYIPFRMGTLARGKQLILIAFNLLLILINSQMAYGEIIGVSFLPHYSCHNDQLRALSRILVRVH